MPRAPLPSPSSTSNTSTSKSPRQRDVKPPQSPHNLPSTSKRRRSPSPLPAQTKRHRLSNSSISPNLLLHQRLNAVQDIFTHLIDSGVFPTDPEPIRDAMRKCQELGAELDEHFGQQSEPSNICPACNLTLSKMCHLRRHVRTKAVKCPKHAALLSDMSSMQCRRCKRQFTRREDVSRHEAKCSSSCKFYRHPLNNPMRHQRQRTHHHELHPLLLQRAPHPRPPTAPLVPPHLQS
ncbi:hypothetical protein K440DRAFT_100635 [Wilcoxina mikolae CBS 423.85]|nr:hypothetical protein K440DRAFT_100635 [Wilcoxina mikolae CBS 423.85]